MVLILIAGIPLIGYTFGDLGNYTHPAEVLVTSSSCGASINGTGTSCDFVLSNLGAGNTQTVPSVILWLHQGNVTRVSVDQSCQSQSGDTVNAGSQYAMSCSFALSPGESGSLYSGSILLSNGASVPFTGRFG